MQTRAASADHTANRKRALVLGGGFAGVEAATELAKDGGFDVTLVSDRDYLFLFPVSVWIPVRTLPFRSAQVSLHEVARKRGFRLVIDPVREISHADRLVRGAEGTYAYDYLVVATGAAKLKPQGVEHTLSICGGPQAGLDIRERLDALIAKGSGTIAVGFGGNPKDRSAVRGGPAFELLFNIHELLKRRKLRDRFELVFFAPMAEPGERMGPRALSMLDSMLRSTSIPKRVGVPIAAFDEQGVAFTDGTRLDADLVLFIPGAAGHPVVASSDLPRNEAGFVRIDDTGLVEGTTDIYAVGDVAALEGPEWRAKQGHTAEVMARNAAFNILATEAGRPGRKGYQEHLAIMCLMDTGNGAAMVYRGHTRNIVIPLPVIGHWFKQAWGRYARATKLGRIPRVPGL